MIHLQWETTASPERDAAGDAVSPEGDLLASPNFGICDTTQFFIKQIKRKFTVDSKTSIDRFFAVGRFCRVSSSVSTVSIISISSTKPI
jgi:hypothetical protein